MHFQQMIFESNVDLPTSNGLDIVHIYIFVNLFLKPATFTIHALLLCYTKISYNC